MALGICIYRKPYLIAISHTFILAEPGCCCRWRGGGWQGSSMVESSKPERLHNLFLKWQDCGWTSCSMGITSDFFMHGITWRMMLFEFGHLWTEILVPGKAGTWYFSCHLPASEIPFLFHLGRANKPGGIRVSTKDGIQSVGNTMYLLYPRTQQTMGTHMELSRAFGS